MKNYKKILSLALALMLALSLSVTAFAANDIIDTSKTASMNIYKSVSTPATPPSAPVLPSSPGTRPPSASGNFWTWAGICPSRNLTMCQTSSAK